MDEEVAEKIELTAADESGSANGVAPLLVEDPSEPLNFAENSDSRADNPPAKGASARIPLRVPKFLLGLIGFSILLLSCGTYMMFVAEKPLVEHQVRLWQGSRGPAGVQPSMVAVATRAIAPGELFTAENVSMEPMNNRKTRYPVGYPEYLYGGICDSGIAAGALIDARGVGPVTNYPWSMDSTLKCYAVVSKPLKAGEYIGGNVNYRKIRKGEVLPAGAFVCDGVKGTAYEALQDLTPGTIVLSSQLKESP